MRDALPFVAHNDTRLLSPDPDRSVAEAEPRARILPDVGAGNVVSKP